MPTKKELLKKLEREVVEQEKEKTELEESEEITGKKLDVTKAPGVDVKEELEKEWKHEETGRELTEPNAVTDEGDIEKEEEAGEESYPEIEKSIKKEADEEEDED